MTDYQTLANEIGESLRTAERSAQSGNLGQTIADLGTLHGKLGQAFVAFNEVAQEAGVDALDWDPIAGNVAAGDAQRTGGGNKAAPSAE